MHARKFYFLLPLSILLLAGITLLWPAEPANAQCGSQASSCKNCHEVQAEAPVNNDGTGWHQSHAFGDFCEFCHAGNVQATDKEGAHTGMVPPLEDVKAGCSSCHSEDLMERAEVYASALGVTVGDGGTPADGGAADDGSDTEVTAPASSGSTAAVPISIEMVVNDPNTVDYVQRYEQEVLGITPKNWGNITIVALIALVLVGGGLFVVKNENLLGMTNEDRTAVAGTYPTDAVALLPQISEMNSGGRKALNRLLQKPKEAAQLFQNISKLSE